MDQPVKCKHHALTLYQLYPKRPSMPVPKRHGKRLIRIFAYTGIAAINRQCRG